MWATCGPRPHPSPSTVTLLSGPSAADQTGAIPATHIVGTLDAAESGYIVVAGQRMALGPRVVVPEETPVGSSVTATVETLNGRVVATRVGSSSPRVLKGIRSSPHPNSVAGAER